MKTKLLAAMTGVLGLVQIGRAQGTAFSYQGRLTDNGVAANGAYDLQFAIYDAAVGGAQVGDPVTNAAVAVRDGVFSIVLDFGSGIFPGANRWLQIGVRTNGSVGAFTALNPLQPFTASPYAITAGFVTDANVSRLTVPNTSALATGKPVVNNGFITAATVTSGGFGYQAPPTVTVNDTTGTGAAIVATVQEGIVVALTVQNPGNGYSSGATLTIAPPPSNAFQTFLTPNFFTGVNTMTNPNNTFAGSYSGNAAGLTNVNAAALGGIPAAGFWQLGGNRGSSVGVNFLGTTDDQGLELKVNNTRALRLEPNTNGAPNVIAGAPVNAVASSVVGATISGGGAAFYIGNPFTNAVSADFGTVGGGANNMVATTARYATIGGGKSNTIQTNAISSTIGGGVNNVIQTNAQDSAIGGGYSNTIAGFYATIPGGYLNTAAGNYSFAAGNLANANHEGAFVWADHSLNTGFTSTAMNQFLVRAAGGVGIGTTAPQAPFHVVGPGQVVALVDSANPTGTWLSLANSSTGGASWSLISTGNGNGEGAGKLVFFTSAASPGRMNLDASGNLALVGTLSAAGAVVAVGTGAVTVRNDGNVPGLVMTGGIVPGTLRLRNAMEIWPNDAGNLGGRLDVRGLNGAPTIILTGTNGNISAAAFLQTSDRNAKENFASIDKQQMLEKVVALPITRWTFKGDAGTAHVGPMAQDFYAAFGLGADEKHITTLDEEGVGLAALQGLNQKLEEKCARIKQLEARLDRLEALVGSNTQSSK